MHYIHMTGQTIYVGAVLSEEDKKRLFNIKKNPDKIMERRDKLRKLLYNSSSNEVSNEALVDQIELLYADRERVFTHSELVTLSDFNQGELFLECQKITTFSDVIESLAKPMLDRKWIQAEYMHRIEQDVYELHQRLFLFRGVLLLHTDYRNGSFQSGISMLYVEEPFFIEGEAVQLFILLATEERMTHVPLLFELDALLNSSFLANIKNGMGLFESFQKSTEG